MKEKKGSADDTFQVEGVQIASSVQFARGWKFKQKYSH
jgi:hypothetical protein